MTIKNKRKKQILQTITAGLDIDLDDEHRNEITLDEIKELIKTIAESKKNRSFYTSFCS